MNTSKILFIDIETNGVNPALDSIIEIAGVVCNWNGGKLSVEDKFDSLVKINLPIDPIVTRITGIDDQLLSEAPQQSKVREVWAEWLDKHFTTEDNVIVVGHSIKEFDSKFLANQNWYLPENHIFLDTLYLAKILLPHISAVNLEYLVQKFKLDGFVSRVLPDTILSSHRALYDTLCCCGLYEKLFNLLATYKLPQSHLDFIKPLLPIDTILLEYVSLSQPSPEVIIEDHKENRSNKTIREDRPCLRIDWNGTELKELLFDLLNDSKVGGIQEKILEFGKIYNLSEKWRLILSQLLVSSFISQKFPWKLKFHGPKYDIAVAQIFLTALLESGFQKNETEIAFPTRLPLIEEIWWQISDAAQNRIDLGNLLFLSEILSQFPGLDTDGKYTEFATELQKFDNAYHFLILSLQPFVVKGVYEYNPLTIRIQEEVVQSKLESLIDSIKRLRFIKQNQKWFFEDSIFGFVLDQWNNQLDNCALDTNSQYTIQLRDNNLVFFAQKKDFNLSKHISALVEKYGQNLQIPTYLPNSDIDNLLTALNLTSLSQQLEPLIINLYESQNFSQDSPPEIINVDLEGGLVHVLQGMDIEAGTTLILGGSNRAMLKIKELLVENYNARNFLIYGDSGSLTKIISRLRTGFDGLVGLRQSDIWILKNNSFKLPVKNVILVGDYYFTLNKIFLGRDIHLAKSLVNRSIKNRLRVFLSAI